MAWMYLTPIFYPISAVPEGVSAFITANPLYMYITIFRDLVLFGTVPAASEWLTGLAVALAMMAVGALIFRKMQRNFILYI